MWTIFYFFLLLEEQLIPCISSTCFYLIRSQRRVDRFEEKFQTYHIYKMPLEAIKKTFNRSWVRMSQSDLSNPLFTAVSLLKAAFKHP